MSIPANITAEWNSVQAQVTANMPLLSASSATRTAIKLNAAQLVTDIQAALVAPNNLLDTWVAPTDPVLIINGILQLVSAAGDQGNLALLRGVAGRASINLDRLP